MEEGDAKPIVRFREVRLSSNRLVECGDGIIVLLLLRKAHAETVTNQRVIRLQLDQLVQDFLARRPSLRRAQCLAKGNTERAAQPACGAVASDRLFETSRTLPFKLFSQGVDYYHLVGSRGGRLLQDLFSANKIADLIAGEC